MALLKRKGMIPIKTQVLVHSQKLGIKAFIDIVAINSRKEVVVIELKSTRTSMGEHCALYHKETDKHKRSLRNNIADTEEHHHYLQAGFGALALQHTYKCISKMSLRVSACIVVSCTDGVRLHTVPTQFMMPSQFKFDAIVPEQPNRGHGQPLKIPVIKPWPTDTTAFAQQLANMGFNSIQPMGPKSEYAILCHRPYQQGARVGVAVCLDQQLVSLTKSHLLTVKKMLDRQCKLAEASVTPQKPSSPKGRKSPIRVVSRCKPEVTASRSKIIPFIICPNAFGRWEIRS